MAKHFSTGSCFPSFVAVSSPANEYFKSKTDKDLMEFVSMVTLYTNLSSKLSALTTKRTKLKLWNRYYKGHNTYSITDGWSLTALKHQQLIQFEAVITSVTWFIQKKRLCKVQFWLFYWKHYKSMCCSSIFTFYDQHLHIYTIQVENGIYSKQSMINLQETWLHRAEITRHLLPPWGCKWN